MERAAIVAETQTWKGTRYHHQGRVKGVGVDCIGLVGGVAFACGVAEAPAWAADREFFGYARVPDGGMLLRAARKYLDEIPVAAALPGDIFALQFTGEPQHFAILSALDPAYIVHAYLSARKVVENRVDAEWRARIVTAFRFRGID